MKNNKWGVIGLIATAAGLIINFVSSIASKKQEEAIIDRKVNEAVNRIIKSKEG